MHDYFILPSRNLKKFKIILVQERRFYMRLVEDLCADKFGLFSMHRQLTALRYTET